LLANHKGENKDPRGTFELLEEKWDQESADVQGSISESAETTKVVEIISGPRCEMHPIFGKKFYALTKGKKEKKDQGY